MGGLAPRGPARALAAGLIAAWLVTAGPGGAAAADPPGLPQWTIDNLRVWLEGHRRTAGAFESDLFPHPERAGFCPGWGDTIAAYVAAYSRECSEALVFSPLAGARTAAAALAACVGGTLADPLAVLRAGEVCKDSPVTPEDLAKVTGEDVDAARKKLEALRKELRDRGVRQTLAGALDLTSLWKDLAKCSLKALATAGEGTEGERGEWRTLIDAIDAVVVDFGDFAEFAGSVAELGPMALKDRLPKSAPGVVAFVKETQGLAAAAEEALQKRGETLQGGLMATAGAKERELAGEVEAVLGRVDACAFDQAVDDAQVLANKISARMIELRHRVAIAEKAVLCVAQARRVFDARAGVATLADRRAFLDGRALVPAAPQGFVAISEVLAFQAKTAVHDRLLAEYVKLRVRTSPEVMTRRRAAFEQVRRERAGRIVPLVQAADRQIAACVDPARSGVALSADVLVAALQAELEALDRDQCREPLVAAFGDELRRASRTLETVELTRRRASSALQQGRQRIDAALAGCDVGTAFDHWQATGRELSLNARLASGEADRCYGDEMQSLETAIETRAASLSALVREADRSIAEARASHAACRPDDTRQRIAAARAVVARAACPAATGARARLDDLARLEREKHPECERAAKLPDVVHVVVTVAGSGYVPHWSGGSWAVEGQDDLVLALRRDERLADRIAALEKELVGDPCRATSPSVSGARRPWFWTGKKPQIGVKQGPETDRSRIAAGSLQDTWRIVHDHGPSLFELKRSWGCGG
jgi:hypothetical protein